MLSVKNTTTNNLKTVEIKSFIQATSFDVSKQFYIDLGFTKSPGDGATAYFHHGNSSFLLQDFYDQSTCENTKMHLLVEDVHAWHNHIHNQGLPEKYDIKVTDIVKQPWYMLDFTITDPSGVEWRIAQNLAHQ